MSKSEEAGKYEIENQQGVQGQNIGNHNTNTQHYIETQNNFYSVENRPILPAISAPLLSSRERQNRARLLKRVRTIWIKGLLENSLHRAVWIDLHLQEQPDALENPWRLYVQELNREPHALPAGTSIIKVYDETDGQLLLLGEAGSGKTTLLLQLVRTLLDRAEEDEHLPMPIVFLLPSWAQKQEPLAHWLVEELKARYQVPRQLAQDWINTDQVLPLLDGLDEVTQEARGACVQAITAYSTRHANQTGTPLVICCRSEDYQALSTPLSLQRAVSILPFSDEQVETYLSSAQGHLEGLRHLLRTDANFATFAHRPLILSIIVLAFRGKRLVNFPSPDNFPSPNNFPSASQEQILRIIFATYVRHMLKRRKAFQAWTQEQCLHWLKYLAKQLHQQQQTIFSVEELQPDWLPQKQRRLYRWSVSLLFGLGIVLYEGLVWMIIYWLFPLLFTGRIGNPIGGLLGLLPLGLFEGLFCGFFFALRTIRPFEDLTWSRADILSRIFVGLSFGVGGGGLFLLSRGLRTKIAGKQLTERHYLAPNEGIRRSAKNGIRAGLLLIPLVGTFPGLFAMFHAMPHFGLGIGLVLGLLEAVFSGLFYGVLLGLFLGLGAFLQHYILRFWLCRTNCIPRDLVPFLDDAAERLLLRKIGGSYIFIHRLLLEYFVTLDDTLSSDAKSSEQGTRGTM